MHRGIEITPPLFEIGPKAYLYGEGMLALARHADAVGRKYDVQVILTPQYVDIASVACEMKKALVFAQHMDYLPVGRGIGSVLPEAVKAAGAAGVLLNHAEKKLSRADLERTMKRADEVGLATMVCADNLAEAKTIARLRPNIIIAEAPELIGIGKRTDNDREMISTINNAIWDVDPNIRVLHGAGIGTGKDVYDIIAAGAQGTGSTSGIMKASDPLAMTEEMIRSVRMAWDASH